MAKNRIIRQWTVIAEAAAADVTGAERHHPLTEEVIVSVRSGHPLKLCTNRPEEADRVVALLERLIADSRRPT